MFLVAPCLRLCGNMFHLTPGWRRSADHFLMFHTLHLGQRGQRRFRKGGRVQGNLSYIFLREGFVAEQE